MASFLLGMSGMKLARVTMEKKEDEGKGTNFLSRAKEKRAGYKFCFQNNYLLFYC